MSETPITDYDIVLTMMHMGGSFAKHLAEAWYCGDTANQARLKSAFPELWEEYRGLAELRKAPTGDTQ